MRLALFTVLATSVLAAVVLVGFTDVARADEYEARANPADAVAVGEASRALGRLTRAQAAAATAPAPAAAVAPPAAEGVARGTTGPIGAAVSSPVEVDLPVVTVVGVGAVLFLFGLRRRPLSETPA